MRMAESVAQLTATLDALAEVDLAAVGDEALARNAVALDAASARLAATQARGLAEVEARGVWTARRVPQLRRVAGPPSPGRAGPLLGSRTPRSLAAIDDRHRRGPRRRAHRRRARPRARPMRRFAPEELDGYEATLVAHAETLTWREFLTICAAWRDAVDPAEGEQAADRVHQRRHLVVHRRPATLNRRSQDRETAGQLLDP